MSLLLHVCCGPCLLYPAKVLGRIGLDFSCYFYNPNIHPYREFKIRLEAFTALAQQRNYKIIVDKDYGLMEFMRAVVFKEKTRCSLCYDMRLSKTAQIASEKNFDSFSTTLLYSKYQNHAIIKQKGIALSSEFAVSFYYDDFRNGWTEGVDESVSLDIYRQKYCGCIYSEQERFDNRLKKRLRRERKINV